MADTDRALSFTLNGHPVETASVPGESLLSVLRERLRITSVKDGCAPQGQCGCCTVLVDGSPRVSCVTPAERVVGRAVTTVEGLDPAVGTGLAEALCATGGSQCGFCTPGIVVRLAGRAPAGAHPSRALAAHLCRCTGWLTIAEAAERAGGPPPARDLAAASQRATLEGGTPQRVGLDVPLGAGGFADDTAPADALVAVPAGDGGWVVADTLREARARAGKIQGRNTPLGVRPPIEAPAVPSGGVGLATSWVEPAYLELDASWCVPGGEPASPLANGGAFGGKEQSIATTAARALADEHGRAVRVLLSREDSVRFGPKRPPVAAAAVLDGSTVRIDGRVAEPGRAFSADYRWPYALGFDVQVDPVAVKGPPASDALRAAGWAEQALLVEGALSAAGVDRRVLVDEAGEHVLLDTSVRAPSGARAGARVAVGSDGQVTRVQVRVAAGDPLDEVVLRSYCVGAAHMALGWVLSEGIAVDRDTGEVHDLTIRSFGILRPDEMPPVDVEIADPTGPPLARASDAVFAAVAAATWNALGRPPALPARRQ